MNWKFALCLIAFGVVGINCRSIETRDEKPAEEKQSYTYTFEAGKKAKNVDNKDDRDQISCNPKDLCKKVAFKKVVCKGDLTFPILSKQPLTDYTCESEEYTATKEPVQWEYKVMCAYEGNLGDDDEPGNDKNKTCYVLIKLTETPTSKVGLIIGIIVLVIAVLVGVVALLGYRGIGPMRSVFGK